MGLISDGPRVFSSYFRRLVLQLGMASLAEYSPALGTKFFVDALPCGLPAVIPGIIPLNRRVGRDVLDRALSAVLAHEFDDARGFPSTIAFGPPQQVVERPGRRLGRRVGEALEVIR